MFTGIVKDVGEVVEVGRVGGDRRLVVETDLDLSDAEIGESIAVDGACLTVVESPSPSRFAADVSPETARATTLGEASPGRRVHLERALRVGDRLGGHFVQGHVDGVGRVESLERDDDSWILTLEAPEGTAQWLVPKGSVAVDGVSLTINGVDGRRFWVTVVPHTAEATTLTESESGDRVNVEADLLGKYAERSIGHVVDEDDRENEPEETRE